MWKTEALGSQEITSTHWSFLSSSSSPLHQIKTNSDHNYTEITLIQCHCPTQVKFILGNGIAGDRAEIVSFCRALRTAGNRQNSESQKDYNEEREYQEHRENHHRWRRFTRRNSPILPPLHRHRLNWECYKFKCRLDRKWAHWIFRIWEKKIVVFRAINWTICTEFEGTNTMGFRWQSRSLADTCIFSTVFYNILLTTCHVAYYH